MEATLDLCKKESILTYNIGGPRTTVSDENLDKWEATICYNGYSTVFHMLYPLAFNMLQGQRLHALTDEETANVRKTLRKELLMVMEEMRVVMGLLVFQTCFQDQ